MLPTPCGPNDDRARFYYHLVYHSLHEVARRALDAMIKGYEYKTDFAKKYVAQGLEQGLEHGLEQGREQGRVEEARRLLLNVLRVRGIAVPEEARERILAQKDPELLERWVERAIVAASVADVVSEPS